MEIDLNQTGFEKHRREISILLGHYHLRYLRRLAEVFDGDLVLPLILGEVAHRNVGAILGERRGVRNDVDQQVLHARQQGRLVPCSAMSVSLATGLSRETVRRKLNKLVEQGFLEKHGSSYITTTKPLELYTETVNKEQLVDLLSTSAEVSKLLKAEGR